MPDTFKNKDMVWLASYPRSGNTLLRTILWHCFALRSASIYPRDLGYNQKLEEYVGHIEHGPDKKIVFPEEQPALFKTHNRPSDNSPAIYLIRDGRAASVSLWKFERKKYPLERIIEGQHKFGTWSDHLQWWNPWERPNTLLLRYEDLIHDLPAILSSISEFLHIKILNENIPDRDTIASVDGRWVTKESNWRLDLAGNLLEKFNQLNLEMLVKAGYEVDS